MVERGRVGVECGKVRKSRASLPVALQAPFCGPKYGHIPVSLIASNFHVLPCNLLEHIP